MKQLVIAALVIAGGFYGYREFASPGSAAEKHYKAFAEEVLHRRYEAAAAMTDGLSATDLSRNGTQEKAGGPAMFQTLYPSKFTIQSNETAADGTVTLRVVQTVLFTPVGVESTRPAMYATMKQVVTLKEGSGGWKVTSFDNEWEKTDSLTGG